MPLLLNVYATLSDPALPTFPHRPLGARNVDDPALLEHLDGFIGYVMNASDAPMTAQRYHLYRHIQRVRWQFSLELDGSDLDALHVWAFEANAVVLWPDGGVRDNRGKTLFHPDAALIDDDAELPYPDDAEQRRERTLQALSQRQLTVPVSLPPVIGETEVELRDVDDVAARMQAVFAVAVRGESLQGDDPLATDEILARLPRAASTLSPDEQAFMAAEPPDPQQIIDAVWRYEALAVLQWAMGWLDALPFPDQVCDVSRCAELALTWADSASTHTATLRPAGEILDALDLHLRLHWLTRQARLDETDPPAGLIPGVIAERHHALNWLVRFESRDWDDIDTPT